MFYEILIQPGSGFLFSTLLMDLIVFLITVFAVKNMIIPALRNYRLATVLNGLCGTDSRHWLHGHTIKYGFSQMGLLNIAERSKKFPFVFNSWIGPFLPEVSTHHSRSIKAVLSSGAPKNETGYRLMRPWIGDGLLTSSGKKWLRNRRLLTPAFHYNVLKPYLKIFNASAKVLLEKWEGRDRVEVSGDVSLMTLDTMLQCAMSFKTECQHVRGKHPYIDAVQELGRIVLDRIRNPIMLLDFIFYCTPDGYRFYKANKIVHDQAEQIIKKRREILAHKNSDQKEGKRTLDFLDILLETRDEDGKGLTDREIRDEVDTFLFEGHDTTASGISWILYNMAKYPELQEKCRAEVQQVLVDRTEVEWEDLTELPYTTMFIKESMRLNPPVPGIGRYLKEPLTVPTSDTNTVQIPPRANVAVMIFGLHRNPHVWPDPEKFDPERFNLENSAKRSPHAYIPFSAGPRNCIGQNFAMNEIKVAVAQALQSYQFYLDHQTPEPVMDPRLILWSKNGIFVKIRPIKEIA